MQATCLSGVHLLCVRAPRLDHVAPTKRRGVIQREPPHVRNPNASASLLLTVTTSQHIFLQLLLHV